MGNTNRICMIRKTKSTLNECMRRPTGIATLKVVKSRLRLGGIVSADVSCLRSQRTRQLGPLVLRWHAHFRQPARERVADLWFGSERWALAQRHWSLTAP